MPICPFCRKPVNSAFTVWCSCGTNLSSYRNLPNKVEDVKPWLERNAPDILRAPHLENSLIDQAKQALIKEQESEIREADHMSYEITQVNRLFHEFLDSCRREGIEPNFDVGRLRSDRYKQQKKLKQMQNMPIKNFKQTPAFHFKIDFGRSSEDFYLTDEGTLYRHHMNIQDPFPIAELLKFATIDKIAEGLRMTLVDHLRQRQTPPASPAEELT